MATVLWAPNAAAIPAVTQVQVTNVSVGGTLVATINTKTIVYTVVTGDTATTAAAAWFALLNASTVPAEFGEITWANPSVGVVTATAKTAGVPFFGMTGGLVFSATGGCTVLQTTAKANSSPSDVGNPLNYLRNNVNALPQNGDDLTIANTGTPMLWNLDALQNVLLNSLTRWQTFTGAIGLLTNNPNGYREYRPTYLKLKGGPGGSSSSGSPGGGGAVLQVLLGFGVNGSGPTLERYDFQGILTSCTVLASGTPTDTYAIRLLGTNAANSLVVSGSTVAVAMLPGEVAALASAKVSNGACLSLGPGCAVSGAVTVGAAGLDLNCPVGSLLAQDGSQVIQGTVAPNQTLTYTGFTLKNGSSLTWLSPSSLNLTLQTSSTFDKSQDQRSMTMTGLTIDVDSCVVNDPYNAIVFASQIVCNNRLGTGPFRFAAGRNVTYTNP